MSRIIWTVALIGLAGWSVLVGSVYGLVEVLYFVLTGGASPPPADSFTTGDRSAFQAVLPWLAALKTVGSTVIVAVWLAVSAVILGAAFMLGRVFRPAPTPRRGEVSRDVPWNGRTIDGVVVPPPGGGDRGYRPRSQS